MILAADLGGTKCTLALMKAGSLETVRERTYKSKEHASLDACVRDFLEEPSPELITGACFAVAGPIHGRTAEITNLTWTIDADALATLVGGAPVSLLNDLQATALGTLVLPDDKLAVLQEGTRPEHATIAVIAPGTGLGEATLISDGHSYWSLPSEGGHADFAPTTDEELELLRFLRKKYHGHVSNERVLCGNGIGDVYDFLRGDAAEPPALAEGDRNAAITELGLAQRDPHCVRALEMFAEALGAEAGNHALRTLATGGVVIGGGIPPKLLPALQTGALIARFCAKGRFAGWMKTLSVRVSLEPRAALLGAAHHVASQES